jgi:hypothetical protein
MVKDMSFLAGSWTFEGADGHEARISVSDQSIKGQSIKINMEEFGRPNALGSVINDSTIEVTFPDDRTYTANVEEIRKIKWSNGTVWEFVLVIE